MESEVKKASLPNLFLAFVKIGALTFGGGYAMLPMLERECADKYGWISREELLDYIAISQCIPGIIAVNTALFVGIRKRGLLGALFAMLGVVMPSLVIITIIAAVMRNFTDIPAVGHAFAGIRVAVGVLIVNALIRLARQNRENLLRPLPILICALAFAALVFFDLSPVFVVLGAALVGLVFGRGGNAR